MCTKADLENNTSRFDPPFLLCLECGSEYSADPRDYFMLSPLDPMVCGCGVELVLARTEETTAIIAD